MYHEDEDEQLFWMPSSTRSSGIQLPLNLRTSTMSCISTASYTSRISSIFSNDCNEDEEDDPFELKKMTNTTIAGTRSTTSGKNDNVGLLVQIDSDSPLAKTHNKFDMSSRLMMAMETLQNDSDKTDSSLSLRIASTDLLLTSASDTSAPSSNNNNLNSAFTNWDLLKDEAQALAGELKQQHSPKTPKSSLINKNLNLSPFSPALAQSPLIKLDDSQDFCFKPIDYSPNVAPIKQLKFDNISIAEPIYPTVKKKLPFSLSPNRQNQAKSLGQNQAKSLGQNQANGPSLTLAKKPLPTFYKTRKSSTDSEERKENSNPNFVEATKEVFIDDQLERAISASQPKTMRDDGLDRHKKDFAATSFVTPMKRRPLLPPGSLTKANTSVRERSMISSTPLASAHVKAKSSLAPLRTGLATPIKPISGGFGHNFATPQTKARSTPGKSFVQPSQSSTLDKSRPRYSLATPLPSTRLQSPQTKTPQTKPNPRISMSTGQTYHRKPLQATPVISKPTTSAQAPSTASKLQALRQGPILRSKISMSSSKPGLPVKATPVQTRSSMAQVYGTSLSESAKKQQPIVQKSNLYLNFSASKIPSKMK